MKNKQNKNQKKNKIQIQTRRPIFSLYQLKRDNKKLINNLKRVTLVINQVNQEIKKKKKKKKRTKRTKRTKNRRKIRKVKKKEKKEKKKMKK